MLIPDSLRMEHMPKIVYVLVKLVNAGLYSEEELRKRITASICKEYNDTSRERFNLLLSFACDGNLIYEENGYYKTKFVDEELRTFSEFTYALLSISNMLFAFFFVFGV